MNKVLMIPLLFISYFAWAQTNTAPYTLDYEFAEGIYLAVDQFKNNSPILKSQIVSEFSKTDVDFLKQVLQNKYFIYKNFEDKEQEVSTAQVWGYSQNNTLHIYYNNRFCRVNSIGTLMPFTAVVTLTTTFMNPMYSNYGVSTITEELRQFIFDSKTNTIVPFDVQNISSLLKQDSVLYHQYNALRKWKKEDAKFIYLRKYNEKYPLMLPRN